MDGFFLVDKPVGMTSHDVVKHIKREFHIPKVGHTGTLDPFASGLLIICIGKATKLSDLFMGKDKTYTGTIVLGKHYDSYDTTGNVLSEKPVDTTKMNVLSSMNTFIGGYEQEPPMHSAIKINGQKLYKLAHQGKSIDRPKRSVMINRFDLISFDGRDIVFEVNVSKGTYIRSLAVDLAHKLHTKGALSILRRLRIGMYQIKDAKPLDKLSLDDLIPINKFFESFKHIVLNDYMVHLVKNGVVLDERQTTINEPFVVKDEKNTFIAYYEPYGDNKYKPIIIL